MSTTKPTPPFATHTAPAPARMGIHRRLAGMLAILFACGSALAQDYTWYQTLRASTSAEGQPYLHHGTKVAVDGALAVVADAPSFRNATTVRTYTRMGRDWVPSSAPALDFQNVKLLGLAMHDNLLAIVLGPAQPGGAPRAPIYEWQSGQWTLIKTHYPAAMGTYAAVALHGDIVAIGFPDESSGSGMAFLYHRQPNGSWTTTHVGGSSQTGASFGHSIAIVAGALVVGAPTEDVTVGGQLHTDAGAAYVYELTTPNWSLAARLTSPTPQLNANFGWAVAISGLDEATPDRLLVGAPRENNSLGAAYGYRRVGSAWTPSMRLEDTGGFPSQRFGSRLALDGAHGAIGAINHMADGNLSQAGAVYGATFAPNFTSATLTRRFDPVPQANAQVGSVVAIDRDGPTLMVGVPKANLYSVNDEQGIVLLSDGFGAAPDFPTLQRVFDLGQGLASAQFGHALDADGEVLIVGAPHESVGNQWSTGAAYLFRRQGNGTYAQEARLQSPSGLSGDLFGMAVAVRGDIALVGAPGGGHGDRGVAYAYRRSGGAWVPEATLIPRCMSPVGTQFGRRIAFDGSHALIGGLCTPEGPGLDLGTTVYTRAPNGSWSGTTIVDTPRMGSGAWDAGLAVIGMPSMSGSASNYTHGSVWTCLPDGSGGWTMTGVAGAGTGATQGYGYDVAADQGVLAVASHAPNHPVTVHRRSGDIFLPEASLIAGDLGTNDAAQSVAIAGTRIAFGVPGLAVPQAQQGAVYLFGYGNGAWMQRQKLVSRQPQAGAFFGHDIAMAADGTLFVSAPLESDAFQAEGGVQVFAPPRPEVFKDGFE